MLSDMSSVLVYSMQLYMVADIQSNYYHIAAVLEYIIVEYAPLLFSAVPIFISVVYYIQ